jgi:putative addiction module component (TIGR02574 family)
MFETFQIAHRKIWRVEVNLEMTEMTEILKLSPAEKILLIEKIWDSVDRDQLESTSSQKQEMKRRLERFKEGKTKFYLWGKIKEELRG